MEPRNLLLSQSVASALRHVVVKPPLRNPERSIKKERRYSKRRPDVPKSTSADFPAVPRVGPGGEA